MLMAAGRLKADAGFSEFNGCALRSRAYRVHPITPEVAELYSRLFAAAHQDPADRILAAAAIVLRAPLVTADEFLRRSRQVRTVWQRAPAVRDTRFDAPTVRALKSKTTL